MPAESDTAAAATTLSYVDWIKAKAQHKTSEEDKAFLANRVRRLREEQRSVEAHINNARERIATIEEARHSIQAYRTEKERRREEQAAALTARQQAIAARRRQLADGIASARAATIRSNSSHRDRILKLEVALERSVSARRAKEAEALARRRQAIREMEQQGVAQRAQYLEERKQHLLHEHVRNGSRVLSEHEENVKTAGQLMVMEADLIRNLVDLRREFRREGQRLATLVTPTLPSASGNGGGGGGNGSPPKLLPHPPPRRHGSSGGE